MNLNELPDISKQKLKDLKQRLERLGIDLSRVEEQFTKGGGPGGQKINKTANCVVLTYPPLELQVRCQRERQRSVNRFIALRELVVPAEGVPFLTMELVDGVAFNEYVRGRTPVGHLPNLVRLGRALGQLVVGIHHLHLAQCLHRDVKPSNVLWLGPGGW